MIFSEIGRFFTRSSIGRIPEAIVRGLIFGICFMACAQLPRDSAAATTLEVMVDNGILSLKAENTTLGVIIDSLSAPGRLKIKGLEDRYEEVISIQIEKEPLDAAFKRLLRALNEANYALEYFDGKLTLVSVFPAGPTGPPPGLRDTEGAPGPASAADPEDADMVRAVRIVSILDLSQANLVGLAKEDIVVEYQNREVRDSSSLIKAVRQNIELEQVELVVMRDGRPLSFFLKGGQIGIRIKTQKVPRDLLGPYGAQAVD